MKETQFFVKEDALPSDFGCKSWLLVTPTSLFPSPDPASPELCWVCRVTQSRLTLFNPVDCSQLGSPVHGILQARILEWVAISFSRRCSLTQGSNPALAGRFLTTEPPGKPKP